MIKLSRFTYILSRDGCNYLALFNSIKITTAFINNDESNFIKKLEFGVEESELSQSERSMVDQLVAGGFIVSDNNIDNIILSEAQSSMQPRLSLMYLIITDYCNLGCKYCFIEAGFPTNYKCQNMSWDTAKQAMDYFIDNRDQSTECSVWLYGGEPLMNAPLLFKCLDYLSEKDPDIRKVMISNGTLITDKIAKRLSTYSNFQISISLDGTKEINDQMRIDKSGAGSFDKIIAGISHLRANNINFGISCTIAEHNVDIIDEMIKWICDNTGSKDIGVNFLVDTPRAFVDEEYIKRANDGMIKFFDQARFTDVFEGRMFRKLDAFVRQQPRWHDCGACGEQIVISPSGEIGICHEGLGERRTFVGSLNSKFDFYTNSTIQEWAKRSPVNMPECESCIALGICGGGCPYGAMLRYGSIWNVDKRFCIHSKDTLTWLIWDLYDKVKLQYEK